MAERGACRPRAKRRRKYKNCEHCRKDLSIKIYKEHKRLYYNPATKSWCKDLDQQDDSSTEFSDAFSDIDKLMDSDSEKSTASCCESDNLWNDELSTDNRQSSTDDDDISNHGKLTLLRISRRLVAKTPSRRLLVAWTLGRLYEFSVRSMSDQ